MEKGIMNSSIQESVKYYKAAKVRKEDIQLLWLFFLLLMFEGILRKWLLAPFATPIMGIKQILACYMVIRGYQYGYIKNGWATFSIILGTIGFITTLVFGHQIISVALFGCLEWWFGIPLCFYIKNVARRQDIQKMMKFTVYFSIFHFITTAIQFFSSTTALINRQIGNEIKELINTDISQLGGGFRPTGLFGHSTMSGDFGIFALGIILFYFFRNNYLEKSIQIKNKLILATIVLYGLTCIFSVSRGLIFKSIMMIIFLCYFCMPLIKKVKHLKSYIVALCICISFLFFLPGVQKGLENIGKRFENAAETQFSKQSTLEGSINDVLYRGILYTINAVWDARTLDGKDVPFWGYGQGLSTQIGGHLAGIKKDKNAGFALAEWDGLRIMCESGFLLGLSMLLCRIGFIIYLFPKMKHALRLKNYLPCFLYFGLLFEFGPTINWGNLFLFNFAMFYGGFFLATTKYNVEKQQSFYTN